MGRKIVNIPGPACQPADEVIEVLRVRTRVKICGITRNADARFAVRVGADALGFVFFAGSSRNIGLAQARELVTAIPAFVASVGLFVDPEPEFVESVLHQVPLDLLQFHGDESPADCRRYGRPYIKAVRMRDDVNLGRVAEAYHDARGLLLDAFSERAAGGTGETFDWARVPRELDRPIILAGGLHADNVAGAIARVRPYAVDVSSGVEAAKGVKDEAKIGSFMAAVSAADSI